MNRITTHELYLQMTEWIAKRSICQRAQVGCVITLENRIISTGYNGPLKGDDICNESTCNLSLGCIRAVHAEANAIYFAAKHGLSLDGTTLYCRFSPCMKCTEAIISAGIKEVHFLEFYRDTKPVDKLLMKGIKVYKGYEKSDVTL